jgi:formylglycine-generating enzyme required for sulfatase activity
LPLELRLNSVPNVVPALEEVVVVPAGSYRLGEPGEERVVELPAVTIGRWPVTNAQVARFVEMTRRPVGPALQAKLNNEALADHPATDVTRDEALAFCAWAGEELQTPVRLPTGDEWEALARGDDERPWPWGHSFDEARCNCAEAGWGWTVPVDKHPDGAGPFGAEQLAGNVWEWVADHTADGWGVVRGGSYLDWAWGVRASRALPADPRRATATTGFRIAIDPAARNEPDGRRDAAARTNPDERRDTAARTDPDERRDAAARTDPDERRDTAARTDPHKRRDTAAGNEPGERREERP